MVDDAIVVFDTFEKHLKRLEAVLERLNRAGLTLNKDKRNFCKPELRYLSLAIDCKKVDAITSITAPQSEEL